MEKKTTTGGTNGFANAAKDLVTATKNWHLAVHDVSMVPITHPTHSTVPINTLLGPVVDMTRHAHETWLDMWESSTHAAIDRTVAAMEEVISRTSVVEPPPPPK